MTDQTPKRTVANALVQYETSGMCLPGKKCQMCDCGVENADRAALALDLERQEARAQHALDSLAPHRDDFARVLALVDGQVSPPLSGKYGEYADALLTYLGGAR